MDKKKELKPLVLIFKTEPELSAITDDTRQKLNLERAEKLNFGLGEQWNSQPT